MAKYPNKTFTIGIFNKIAAQAAQNSSCEHPGDIANAMMNAIEYAAETMNILSKNDALHESLYK